MEGTSPAEQPVGLLNVFEVVIDGAKRHLVCFLEPALAEERGISPASIVGEFTPSEGDEFDADTFVLNSDFVDAFTDYMNEEGLRNTDLLSEAAQHPGDWLYILDPRYSGDANEEPPAGDLLGCFSVDEQGRIAPDSFTYNENHALFHPDEGVSAVLQDRRFYDWLHQEGREGGWE
jgi:hypothetical protein